MDTEVLNECRHPSPQTDMFIIRPDFTFVLLGLFMIVAHTIRMNDTIYRVFQKELYNFESL